MKKTEDQTTKSNIKNINKEATKMNEATNATNTPTPTATPTPAPVSTTPLVEVSTLGVNNHTMIKAIKENIEKPENLKELMEHYPEIFFSSLKYMSKKACRAAQPIVNAYGKTKKIPEYTDFIAPEDKTRVAAPKVEKVDAAEKESQAKTAEKDKDKNPGGKTDKKKTEQAS